MEVINQNSAMLSNFEVLSILQDVLANEKEKKTFGKQKQLATVAYETTKYLEKWPCQYQNAEIIKNFMEAVAPFNLTKAEKLQILNYRPVTPVEIQLIVEESEERLTDDQINNLLDVIASVLPGDSDADAGMAEVEEGNDNL